MKKQRVISVLVEEQSFLILKNFETKVVMIFTKVRRMNLKHMFCLLRVLMRVCFLCHLVRV